MEDSRRRFGSGVALVLGLLAQCAAANELATSEQPARTGGIAVHDALETLERCHTDADGRLWLTLPGGAEFELVTSTADPAISNPGDGAFHPFDASVVRAAIDAVRFPLEGVAADVWILPYPRRSGLESAGGARLVLLAPGVRALDAERQHTELVHELGHVVQRALAPDGSAAWAAYRARRGIADDATYSSSGVHAFRPHEIFAEDFRALFGDAQATYSGTIENATLAAPAAVPDLARFMLALAPTASTASLAASPNPARGPVAFSRAGTLTAPLDLFDALGRRVRTLEPAIAGGVVRWSWDGRDAAGRLIEPGVVYARVRGESGALTRITLAR
jgi:hypothetical protein